MTGSISCHFTIPPPRALLRLEAGNICCGLVIENDSGSPREMFLIVETAPILKRFVDQPLDNLIDWCVYRFGDFNIEYVGKDKE